MKTSLTSLTTKDIATLAKRVIESSKNGKYAVVENHQLLIEVENEYNVYRQVYSKDTYSGKGKEVADADDVRDKLFRNLKVFLKGYMAIEEMPNSADAADLYHIFERFGLNIDRLSYAEESAQMVKLIDELEKAENKSKLKALRVYSVFVNMKKAQNDFEALYAKQAEANADLRHLPSASVIRKKLETALRNYFNLLDAMKGVPGWEMIYADINEIVKSV